MNFSKLKLQDVGKIVTGKTPSSKKPEYFGNSYPFITPSDLEFDNRYPYIERFLSEEGYIDQKNNLLPTDSICFTCIGATIGKMCLTNGLSFTNQQINSVIVNNQNHDYRYIYYLLKTKINYIKILAGGAATPIVNKSTFSNIQLDIPNKYIQKIITSILSTYDNLIENNTRRIQILEEMAQRIYKEWFVDFKYPGHENDKSVDSELGMIPEGWAVIEISEKFKTVLGGTPSRKNENYWINGTVPWINSSMVNELRVIDHSELITEEALKKSSTKLMPIRTTVLAITGATLGQVSLLEEEVCANQSVVGVYDENKTFNEFIYLTLTHIIKRIINRAGGGAQQHINKEIVNSVKIFCPMHNVVGSFNKIIIPIFDEIKNMLLKNQNLRQTRDLLLPKLISGKIDVSDLDIDTGILND